jgi:hypothetical protein
VKRTRLATPAIGAEAISRIPGMRFGADGLAAAEPAMPLPG